MQGMPFSINNVLLISHGSTLQNFQDFFITNDESTPQTTKPPSFILKSNKDTPSPSFSSSSTSATPPDSSTSLLLTTGLTFPTQFQDQLSSQAQSQVQSRSYSQSHSILPPLARRRGGKKIQMEIDPKLARRRELNRKAAQRSRQKFKEFHYGLIDKVIELKSELDGLEAEYIEIIKS